jgi:hypothetical protein
MPFLLKWYVQLFDIKYYDPILEDLLFCFYYLNFRGIQKKKKNLIITK